jgi:maltooligosyltrehalose trehalohydrolase
MALISARRFPIGAEPVSGGVHFRVWAPDARRLRVVFSDSEELAAQDLSRDATGYFSGLIPSARAGSTYRFEIDAGGERWPDPASRFQPAGPLGPSQVVDPGDYAWKDELWSGISLPGQVLYEMHIGTFTPEGTWDAAAEQLAELAALGVTVLEIMPVAEFNGRFGWSYDPVNLFAPSHWYGSPDALRRFVDEAHRLRIGVILDVVYNHFSQLGERLLRPFAASYVSERHKNEWGAAPNFDDRQSTGVREYFVANVMHWISEFHIDGLRIDATQAFEDDSDESILIALCRAARQAAPGRSVLIVGENEPQHAQLLRGEEAKGTQFDALWNDDFHHSAMVCLTDKREAYYSDYSGNAEELIAAVKWNFLFQGQRYAWQKKPRGTPAFDLPAPKFINYIQNHDQLANSARGQRIHELTSTGRFRAMTALLLLAPQTPLLFQGQEFAASSPFLYFNDCQGKEAARVVQGRARFLSQFPSLATAQMQARLIDPCDPNTFERSKLDFSDRVSHADLYALHRDLLTLRREDAVFREHDAARLHGASLGSAAFLLRFFGQESRTRLLVINFGGELYLESIAQPLVAPPEGMRWGILWSSEDPRYGGSGTPELDTCQGWHIPGEAAVALHPVPLDQPL